MSLRACPFSDLFSMAPQTFLRVSSSGYLPASPAMQASQSLYGPIGILLPLPSGGEGVLHELEFPLRPARAMPQLVDGGLDELHALQEGVLLGRLGDGVYHGACHFRLRRHGAHAMLPAK